MTIFTQNDAKIEMTSYRKWRNWRLMTLIFNYIYLPHPILVIKSQLMIDQSVLVSASVFCKKMHKTGNDAHQKWREGSIKC